ncbi:MAG TPA: hypothetical protein VK988_16750 [Acidimicrobiales bacterium]|nr:hypothetical protein [Acidimicrobiales bacterium]
MSSQSDTEVGVTAATEPQADDALANEVDEALAVAEPSAGGKKRQKSTIVFPYGDMGDAIAVAEAIWNYGGQCDVNMLTAKLGHEKPTSGAFRIKLMTAKIFRLVEGTSQSFSLSNLGRRIVSDETTAAARAEAFLTVPLYRRIFEEVEPAGGHLPEDSGLEDMIKRMGVVETQADRARQAFQRSARLAGYNQHGPRRLVRPALGTMPTEDPDSGGKHQDTPDRGQGDNEEGIGMNKPAIMTELFRRLPNDGEKFPGDERTRWKAVFEASLDLVYGPATSQAGQGSEANGSEPLPQP